MFKLWSSIKKDWRILTRDKMGLVIMFLMPIILAIVIASVQNSTYELVNNKKITLLFLSNDTSGAAKEMESKLSNSGMFALQKMPVGSNFESVKKQIQSKEALVGIVIPKGYTQSVISKAEHVSSQALVVLSADETSANSVQKNTDTIVLFYHPVLQKSFRQGVEAALQHVLQVVQSKYIVRQLYSAINENAAIPDSLEKQILTNDNPIVSISASKDSGRLVPNATQHNIPAWTVFAMFFIVISLGSNIVKEKTTGSFLRLKTMPTSLAVSIVSKQITYLVITILQAIIIFSIGRWGFPFMGLPALNFPYDIWGLFLVILISGLSATSFAAVVGIFSKTQEQSNGIGAISIVFFAAIGGLLVPSFAMPESFQFIMNFSPLHWSLEAFYGLFLEGGRLKDILINLAEILLIVAIFQFATWWGMKRLKLID